MHIIYNEISSGAYFRMGKRFRWHQIIIRPLYIFMHKYFIWLGFLDGIPELAYSFNRYSTIDAEMAFTEGRKFSVFKLFFQPLERFFARFIVHREDRDGFQGFVIAALTGLNYFMRYLKLWEIGFMVKNNVDCCKKLNQ